MISQKPQIGTAPFVSIIEVFAQSLLEVVPNFHRTMSERTFQNNCQWILWNTCSSVMWCSLKFVKLKSSIQEHSFQRIWDSIFWRKVWVTMSWECILGHAKFHVPMCSVSDNALGIHIRSHQVPCSNVLTVCWSFYNIRTEEVIKQGTFKIYCFR